ncbi:YceI family protein [Lacinutrix iliipiscaria]|uniref:YceI family protein n=1 Tax=Lacinutrix iliipiscaria TaxID=1230532 RepID=A0ABW5WSA5_9FLAO
MKKQVLNIFTVVTLCIAVVGCKKAKEADTSEAEAAAVSESSMQKYNVKVSESVIAWKGFKPTGTHSGSINIDNGVFHMENGDLKSGTFLIDMNSIVCEDLNGEMKAKLEAHLKGSAEGEEGEFFNVAKFPTAAFEVTGTQPDKDGRVLLSGNLTLKDIKNNITFPAQITTEGDMVMIDSDAFTIDRTKWEINYGSKSVFDNLGDKFINDEIELKIAIKGRKN